MGSSRFGGSPPRRPGRGGGRWWSRRLGERERGARLDLGTGEVLRFNPLWHFCIQTLLPFFFLRRPLFLLSPLHVTFSSLFSGRRTRPSSPLTCPAAPHLTAGRRSEPRRRPPPRLTFGDLFRVGLRCLRRYAGLPLAPSGMEKTTARASCARKWSWSSTKRRRRRVELRTHRRLVPPCATAEESGPVAASPREQPAAVVASSSPLLAALRSAMASSTGPPPFARASSSTDFEAGPLAARPPLPLAPPSPDRLRTPRPRPRSRPGLPPARTHPPSSTAPGHGGLSPARARLLRLLRNDDLLPRITRPELTRGEEGLEEEDKKKEKMSR
ncbi:hypothetical protein BRADI_1g61286v3 [Brachypodium distachyon]|uniref:Uncharacterized protein n=1 Tax=Brachypodium distachyon TaxID=15368 RepID=A0A2K2DST0_BRADI|nr:hypothetical protein BRADI_1g61286v3 [Brachypodium distachyon]